MAPAYSLQESRKLLNRLKDYYLNDIGKIGTSKGLSSPPLPI